MVLEQEALWPLRYTMSFIDLPLSHTKLLSFIIQAPKLELKPLSDQLKYKFLGDNETLLVIVSTKFSHLEEKTDKGF